MIALEVLACAVRSRRAELVDVEIRLRAAQQLVRDLMLERNDRAKLAEIAERELVSAASGYRWDGELSCFTFDGKPVGFP